jgi:hypothetical protein
MTRRGAARAHAPVQPEASQVCHPLSQLVCPVACAAKAQSINRSCAVKSALMCSPLLAQLSCGEQERGILQAAVDTTGSQLLFKMLEKLVEWLQQQEGLFPRSFRTDYAAVHLTRDTRMDIARVRQPPVTSLCAHRRINVPVWWHAVGCRSVRETLASHRRINTITMIRRGVPLVWTSW